MIYWDMWPIQTPDGYPALIDGSAMWMALACPRLDDPHARHLASRIHWMSQVDGAWVDEGPVLAGVKGEYEREWSGCAIWESGILSLYFTGAGLASDPGGYEQALYYTTTTFDGDIAKVEWSMPELLLEPSPAFYAKADAHDGEPGKIKALRDPAYFRDPQSGGEFIAFTASLANSSSPFNGAFGLAKKEGEEWISLPPIIHADGVNNELERAHLVFHDERYYAFWSTQSHTFEPNLRHAPTGLYGMVSKSIAGPYVPLNGHGLVAANPACCPCETYSWFVTNDLLVSSFIDYPGTVYKTPPSEPKLAAATFMGRPAPLFQIELKAASSRLPGVMNA